MIELHQLPLLNACLNGAATLLLVAGWRAIRGGDVARHKACMIGALVLSTLFLGSYVAYHVAVGSVRFTSMGWERPIYYAILLTHVPLAALVLPLALVTATQALRGRFDSHRRIARWTLPIWLYVSATGVLVYLMLYQWFPSTDIK